MWDRFHERLDGFSKPAVVTPPVAEPVSIDEAKAQIQGVDGCEEDGLIASYITTARLFCEGEVRRAIPQATFCMALERFPHWNRPILIPNPPFVSVQSIVYTDDTGTSQTMDPSLYRVDTAFEPGRIFPVFNTTWPSTQYGFPAVAVTYTAGYAVVPENLRSAIRIVVAQMYENRAATNEVEQKVIPFGLESLLGPSQWGSYW